MQTTIYVTDKQVEAIAYELAERFLKRTQSVHSMNDTDELAEAIAAAIAEWVNKKHTSVG